ncbi:MAG: zinc ribbon domain-containing protein, partial [Deltaproteobacteria bacterium]|nr:zinc ribbon domain-containing protein [Deltaproteobacteria bacterium]
MPLYEYRCDDCGAEFEELCRESETPPCPGAFERCHQAGEPAAVFSVDSVLDVFAFTDRPSLSMVPRLTSALFRLWTTATPTATPALTGVV